MTAATKAQKTIFFIQVIIEKSTAKINGLNLGFGSGTKIIFLF
jgi:hypothetical protein